MQIEYGDEDLRRLAEDRDITSLRWERAVIAAYRKKLQIVDGAMDMRDLRAMRSVGLERIDTGSAENCYSIRLNEGYRLAFALRLEDADLVVVVLELVDVSVKGGVR
ncbi:type II toxin-antitoxin system RelE/ParE family toxin [Rhodococcus sp. WAY2]|uniref:type II toxin-antitoxin system RelE/ParE family toxin n=1 Tax=Rhodococcus sp. WAY2 TaxID=2663121 RepID=UPI00131FBF39|nr:type II toxin-antitoxin system RelE/ParE family toxin [Rhodococcus sp. WAY2]QHE73618.1 hypothetical protein GFS60_07278 [Rhodococcus sp. WAY2]